MYDLLIRNGKVVDGTGNPWFYADVAIKDGKIVKVGKITESAREVIDAGGFIVAPGFVDIHSHADFILPLEEHPRILEPLIRQGVTTLVTGNCGYSPFPINPETAGLLKKYSSFMQSRDLAWEWSGVSDFLDYLDRQGVAFNVVPLVSHGAIRIALKGFDRGLTTEEEREKMFRLVEEAMQQGSFGLSCGLIYAPGMYSDTEELIYISRGLKEYGGIFTFHLRGYSETLIPAIKEVIKVGRLNNIKVQISHFQAFGKEHWPKIDDAISIIDEARIEGVDVAFDVIPYVAANTTISAIYPPWALEGGVDALLEKLRDKKLRERIKSDIEEVMPGWPAWFTGDWPHNLVRAIGWENIFILSVRSVKNKCLVGKNLLEIAGEKGIEPFEVAADLTIEEHGDVMALYVGLSGDLSNDEGLRKIVACPFASICTDAIITGEGITHPAAYGAFPKVLGYFSRELKLFPMEEAIRKMTYLSLQRFGINDRGLIKEGFFADITIFDECAINEKGSYFDQCQYPGGVKYVILNGNLVLKNGEYSGNLCGKVLRRKEA